MTKFMSNVNQYLSEMQIKQTYFCKITGIDENTLLRMLTGEQEESSADREKIARALRKDVEFFEKEKIDVPEVEIATQNTIQFCGGQPSHKQEQFAEQLKELVENMDEVLGAKSRFRNIEDVIF